MDTQAFDYELPRERIAQSAVEPRDTSRLLIARDLSEVRFCQLPELLDTGDLIVVNTTRVRHARLAGTRADTGGRVEILLTRRFDDARWEALVRPARRLRTGVTITVGDRTCRLLTDPVDGVATVGFDRTDGLDEMIETHGRLPLPPYFSGSLDDDERYQTVFARRTGSAAAPTAALHFTDDLVANLGAMGVNLAHVELEVGLDTFRPMAPGSIEDHVIHTETVHVGRDAAAAVAATHAEGGRVIAVGTTVVRSLESAAVGAGVVQPYHGPTDLFITPGYRCRVVDAVITNFHAPRTTLIVLIAALMGERWRTVYDHALAHGFRFLSFGDAMYFEVAR